MSKRLLPILFTTDSVIEDLDHCIDLAEEFLSDLNRDESPRIPLFTNSGPPQTINTTVSISTHRILSDSVDGINESGIAETRALAADLSDSLVTDGLFTFAVDDLDIIMVFLDVRLPGHPFQTHVPVFVDQYRDNEVKEKIRSQVTIPVVVLTDDSEMEKSYSKPRTVQFSVYPIDIGP